MKFMRANFGRYDGLFLLLFFVGVGCFWVPCLFVFGSSAAEISLVLISSVSVATMTMSVLFALLLAGDLWLMLGNAGMTRRLLTVLALHLLPALFLAVGYAYAMINTGQQIDVPIFFALLSQRLCICLTFLGLGMSFRTFCRWRVYGPAGEATRKRFQTSIGDYMVMTGMFGAIMGCANYWVNRETTLGSYGGWGMEELLFLISIPTIAELAIVLLVLLMPFLMSFGAPWIRRHFPSAVCLWSCFLGLIVCVLWAMILGFRDMEALGVGVTVLIIAVVLGLALLFVLWVFAKLGFGFSPRPLSDGEASVRVATRKPTITRWAPAFGAVMVAATLLFGYFFDLRTLMQSGSFSIARRVAWLRAEHGAFWGRSLGGQAMSLTDVPSFKLKGTSAELIRLLQAIAPQQLDQVEIALADAASEELLNELASRQIVHLHLSGGDIPVEPFDQFCEQADLNTITLQPTTVEHLKSLKRLKGLISAQILGQLNWDVQTSKAMRGLRVDQLQIRFDETSVGDMAGLRGVEALVIYESKITAELAQELAKLRVQSLGLFSCDLDIEAAERIAQAPVERLTWDDLAAQEMVDDEVLVQLSKEFPNVLSISTSRDSSFYNRLRNLAECSSLDFAGSERGIDYDEEMEAVFTRVSKEEGDELAAFKRIATEHKVDPQSGVLVELDLQGLPLFDIDFTSEKLQSLQRLRIGHPTQGRKTFRAIAGIESLRALEISDAQLSAKSFSEICKMKRLTHLQLPWVEYGICRRPEVYPLPMSRLEYLEVGTLAEMRIAMQNDELALVEDSYSMTDPYGGYEGGYGGGYGYGDHRDMTLVVDHDAFAAVSGLEDLEYLFLPGHLLAKGTMPTIESLSKLKELHAVLSFVDIELLKRVTKLSQIESLSIGVESVDKRNLAMLAGMPNLRKLQLTVFDSQLAENKKAQQMLLQLVKNGLAHCEVHLIFLEDFPRFEDEEEDIDIVDPDSLF